MLTSSVASLRTNGRFEVDDVGEDAFSISA